MSGWVGEEGREGVRKGRREGGREGGRKEGKERREGGMTLSLNIQEIEIAKQKILEAAEKSRKQQQQLGMSSNMGFLVTIYIGNKEGDSYGTTVGGA